MVDETAFRQVLSSANLQSCAFRKAILAGCCSCSLVEKHYVAERELIVCADKSARVNCLLLHQLLSHNSIFALKHVHINEPLTHAQEMKLQCGGLIGVQYVAGGTTSIADVVSLVDAACLKFGTLEMLPFDQIVQSITSFKIRKRHNTK